MIRAAIRRSEGPNTSEVTMRRSVVSRYASQSGHRALRFERFILPVELL